MLDDGKDDDRLGILEDQVSTPASVEAARAVAGDLVAANPQALAPRLGSLGEGGAGQTELGALAGGAFEGLLVGGAPPPASRGSGSVTLSRRRGSYRLARSATCPSLGSGGTQSLALIERRIEETLHELAVAALGAQLDQQPSGIADALEADCHRRAPRQGVQQSPASPRLARSVGQRRVPRRPERPPTVVPSPSRRSRSRAGVCSAALTRRRIPLLGVFVLPLAWSSAYAVSSMPAPRWALSRAQDWP